MTLHISTPAPIVETLELVRENSGLKPANGRILVFQLCQSVTLGFRDAGGRLVAAAGFVPLPAEEPGEELHEAWFLCRPDLARDLPAFVRAARLTFARLAHSDRVRLIAHVRVGHAPGERLARLMGMELSEALHGFGRWEWRSGRHHSGPLRGRRRQEGEPAA